MRRLNTCHFLIVSFLAIYLPDLTSAGKDKCGVQVVAIEQIKYKPIPVEVVEKSSMKYEQPSAPAPPPASYSQPTTAAPTYATTTGAPMLKPTSTTSKKMDITELIKEMYGPPPQAKAAPPTPPPPPQVYIMPAPAPPPPRPQMVYMVTNPAPAPPTRAPQPTYSQMRPPQTSYQQMMPPMMPMMMPDNPYMPAPPQSMQPMQGYGQQQPMMMTGNYGQGSPMMGIIVENQAPANAKVNNYGNSVTPNNYAPPVPSSTPAMPAADYGQSVATTTPPKYHASSTEDDYGNSQHLVSFPEFPNEEQDYYGPRLNGPIRGMNINNQLRSYEEMSSNVRQKYPNRMNDDNEEGEDEEEVDETPQFGRQRQRPADVVLGYRVRPPQVNGHQPQMSNFSPPDPTFRDILMTKLRSNSFGRRSSDSKTPSKKELKKIEAEDNHKILNELRLRSQIEQTLDRILFNTRL